MGQYDSRVDDYVYLTFSEVFELVQKFASGLKKLLEVKCCAQSAVSMCSIARLEWYLTDMACLLLGVATVSLDSSIYYVCSITCVVIQFHDCAVSYGCQ